MTLGQTTTCVRLELRDYVRDFTPSVIARCPGEVEGPVVSLYGLPTAGAAR
jgi:hypothetical protein